MPLPIYLMSNFPSVRPSLNLQFDSQPTPEDMTSHLASVGATFSRASTGTYTDANGLIAEASAGQARPNYSSAGVHEGLLIEESRTNKIKSSEDFSTTDCATSNSSVIKNQAIAPDGKASVDKIVEDDTTNSHYINISLGSLTGIYTYSAFVSDAGDGRFNLLRTNGSGGTSYIIVNPSTGTITEVGASVIDSGIEDYGNGIYRAYFSYNSTGNDVTGFIIGTSNSATPSSSLPSYTGDGTSGVYFWGAQVEEGSFPTSYIPTIPTFSSRASTATFFNSSGVLSTASTNVARTDHKYIGGQWLEAGLLLEGASTNEYIYSEDFSSATSLTRGVITNNTISAPDGNTTADTFTDNNSGGTGAVYLSRTLTVSTSTDYTFSVFAKKNTLDFLAIGAINFTSVDAYSWFNLNNGTLGTAGSGISISMEDVSNGWYRCSISFTSDSSDTSGQIRLLLADTDGDTSVDLDGTSSVYLWGAQFEEGSQPSSYIPTTTAEVTRSADVYTTATKDRSADVCYIDGAAFTDFYNQDAGTILSEFYYNGLETSGNAKLFMFNDGTFNNRIFYDMPENQLNQATNGVTQVNIDATDIVVNSNNKSVSALQVNDAVLYTNGIQEGTDTALDMPTVSKLSIGSSEASSSYLNGAIKKLIYFPRRLTNNELIKLTQ